MIKKIKICDICHKEVENFAKPEVNPIVQEVAFNNTVDGTVRLYEICQECSDAIVDYIGTLRKPEEPKEPKDWTGKVVECIGLKAIESDVINLAERFLTVGKKYTVEQQVLKGAYPYIKDDVVKLLGTRCWHLKSNFELCQECSDAIVDFIGTLRKPKTELSEDWTGKTVECIALQPLPSDERYCVGELVIGNKYEVVSNTRKWKLPYAYESFDVIRLKGKNYTHLKSNFKLCQ